jgi:hypothetical protein
LEKSWAGGAGKAGGAGGERSSRPPDLPHPPYLPHPAQGYWHRDEWDVAVSDGAVYRIFQDRDTDAWFIEAIVD